MHLAIEFFTWLGISILLMSFLEHQIHARLMHKSNFLSKRFAPLKKVFESHAIIHHGHYQKTFSDEPVAPGEDRGIRLSMREGIIEALPFSLLIATQSLMGAVIFELVVCSHHFIWNKIHLEMHKSEERFFTSWPIYQFCARHHYMHHRHPDKYFNVVLPIFDYVLGTTIKLTKADLEGMYENGLLPRPIPATIPTRVLVKR